MAQTNIFLLCVHCRAKFYPNRLGQIFCCTEHGWQYRNLMRIVTEESELRRLKGQVANVKLLFKLSLNGTVHFTVPEFKKTGFQRIYATIKPDPAFKHPAGIYDCFGFGVFYYEENVSVYAPWEKDNILNM